jgi:anti-sigma B factor antagonist
MSLSGTFNLDCTFQHPTPGCALVHFAGDLDAFSAPQVHERVEAYLTPDVHRVVLDLSGVDFIDSTGIRLLLALKGSRSSPDVVLVYPRSSGPRKALDIVGIPHVMRSVEGLDEALSEK